MAANGNCPTLCGTLRIDECQSRCRRQDAFQSGGTRIRFQTQKSRCAFGASQAGLQFPAVLTGQTVCNPLEQVFNGIMPSTADKSLYDLVRRNEEPLRAAFAIPKLDLILNLPEGSSIGS
jgi:hypothetical protein